MNNFSNIRTGVIGVGSMGQNHARIYNEISRLVAVADSDEEQGRKVADYFGVKWYSDYRDMLDQVDAVTIAVPTFIHKKVAEIVAEARVHMLVEKPLAINCAEAEEIVRVSKEAGVTLAVGHIERYNPVVSYAKEAIRRGEWGDIITLFSKRVSSFPDRIHDVGVLFDLSIHDIDISHYLADSDINSVYAAGGNLKAENEDHVIVTLSHESGIISVCETNWLTPHKVRRLEITTSSHFIEMDYFNQAIRVSTSKYLKVDKRNLYSTDIEIDAKEIPIDKKEPLLMEIHDFLSSITLKKTPLVTGLEAVNNIRLAQAALDSIRTNKVLNFD